ncbi:MAG: hypothetical protein WC702_01345 [Patescibacteria group bacterium]|jgi:hypothetical protein
MEVNLLNLFLRLSGTTHALKEKLVNAKNIAQMLWLAILLVVVEIIFLIVSLPLFFLVSPKKIQEKGFLFPTKEKNQVHYHNYLVRRKIGIITLFGAGGILVSKVLFVGVISFYLLGAQVLLADTQDWTFDTAGDYAYDVAKIEVTGGAAGLKATNTVYSGATTNPDFTSNANGWTYADWDQGAGESNVDGARQAAGGNPGGWIRIRMPVGTGDQYGGYYYQGFTTTVADPITTLSFDWQVSDYDSTPNPITFKALVFVDTGTGAPVIGQQVWASSEITATSSWAGVVSLDVSSKVTAAGTYYLKVATWIETNTTSGGPYSVGYDNVQLNWSKTVASYDTSKPTIYPNSSLTTTLSTTWDSFTETATKNGGEIYYQLSDDDGVTWQYWNGSAWATAGSTNYNNATDVNSHISAFSSVNKKIKWKAFLESNGSQQVILSNISIGYTEDEAPSVANISPAQNTAAGYVFVEYDLLDAESDTCSLVSYEYSLTGAFAGEEVTMTPVPADPAHSGVTGLSASPTGVTHTFVWDAASQIGDLYDTTVYVRLRPNDGIVNGDYTASSAFVVDAANPIVSNVVASQTAGVETVSISYDLADDTSDTLLVELDISSDSGGTWTVTDISVTGAVGAGQTTGTGKTITWNAGADFSGQDLATMQVHLRATDAFQNVGDYEPSVDFALDTADPVVLAAADLEIQPHGGSTNVVLAGSFTENNPYTNDLYVAINDGSYGTATSGTGYTASLTNQIVDMGVTLDGNDYVSKVKITEADTFGHSAENENVAPNTIYKYVHPYTPSSPVVNNLTETSVNVQVIANPAEAPGLEYAIYANNETSWVQADGSLGGSEVWQTIAAWSTITVTGLTAPASGDTFQTKSRNSSDAAHALTSESALSSGASADNSAPDIRMDSAAQVSGESYVMIEYTGTDLEGDLVDLVVAEYSLDNLTWSEMTEKSGVDSDGKIDLPFAAGGTALTFAWDAGADLSDVEDDSVYVRLQGNDGTADGDNAVSSLFPLDLKAPEVSNIVALQTSGSDSVVFTYDLTDFSTTNLTVDLEISEDSGASWLVPDTSATGHIGSGQSAGEDKQIIWDAGTDFSDEDVETMRIHLIASDHFNNTALPIASIDFALDTKDPVVLATADLEAQPLAGGSEVVIGGSFTESNPNTNELFVALNGEAYGTAVDGLSGAATLTGQVVDVGTVLLGNDYVSKVKIVETDTFSHSAENENLSPASAYLYVKPYIPNSPTVSNPTTDTADVVVNKNSSEVDGLDYAIFESSTGKYVQADGTLGDDAVWQTTVAWSTITVTGLASPISDYVFSTKSRNPSDAAHASTSESLLSAGASTTPTVAPSSTGGGVWVDTVAPNKPVLNPVATPTDQTTIRISGLSEPFAQIDLFDNDVFVQRLPNPVDTNRNFSLSLTFTEGSHSITVKATDEAGNISQFSDPLIFLIDLTPLEEPVVPTPEVITPPTTVTEPEVEPTEVVPVEPVVVPEVVETIPEVTIIPLPTILPIPPAEVILEEAEAIEVPTLPTPEVTLTMASVGGDEFIFHGTAMPKSDVAVYIHSDQALVYQTRADEKGDWQIAHSQDTTELSSGDHTIYAVAVDPEAKIKSQPGQVMIFTVEKNLWASLFSYLNLQTTVITVFVLLVCSWWLLRLKKRGVAVS